MAYSGLYVIASGAITLNNIEASSNGLNGIQLDNRVGTDLAKPVTVANSLFAGNIGDGASILSDRAVTITSIRSTFSNTGVGIKIDNSSSTVASLVTFLGTNLFTYNSENGVEIKSAGNVSIANTTTAYNSWNGLQIDTLGSVLLSKDRAERNGTDGVYIKSANNQITLNGLTSMLNGFLGDWNGLQIDSTTAKVYISNSNFVGNSAWGIMADVINPISDVILYNTNTYGNDLGSDFLEGNVYVY
ncbi:MAG: right-handed parallel beta-helix repeat-containing protein [Anaerolineaceae bacterium]